jgi:N-acetylmuramoyl-L-alanine amidase
MLTLDQNDIDSLALVTWKEARGEGNEGMQAVMHVIFNRVGAPGFPKTLHDVIYQKNAFTSMSVISDPEFNLEPHSLDPQFAYCEELAPNIQDDADVTNGAHYYADLKYTTSGWFFRNIVQNPTEHPQTAVIGRHTFYA